MKPLGGKTEIVVLFLLWNTTLEWISTIFVVRTENTQENTSKKVFRRVRFCVDNDPMDEAVECCIWGCLSLVDLLDLLHPGLNSPPFVCFSSKFLILRGFDVVLFYFPLFCKICILIVLVVVLLKWVLLVNSFLSFFLWTKFLWTRVFLYVFWEMIILWFYQLILDCWSDMMT